MSKFRNAVRQRPFVVYLAGLIVAFYSALATDDGDFYFSLVKGTLLKGLMDVLFQFLCILYARSLDRQNLCPISGQILEIFV